MRYYKKLLGENIYLSPVNEDDAEIFTKWMNDFGVTDYIGRSDAILTLSGEKEWLTSAMCDKKYIFSIVKNEGDELIGNIELNSIKHVDRTATLGIMIGENKERSKGYGLEAINLLLDFAFNYLNMNSVNLEVLEVNERAKRCYEKAGFKIFGIQRENKYIDGKYYNTIHMDILKEEFKGSYIKNKNL